MGGVGYPFHIGGCKDCFFGGEGKRFVLVV